MSKKPVTAPSPANLLEGLRTQLQALRLDIERESTETLQEWQPWITRPQAQGSIHNLAAYLALRRRDLMGLQRDLRGYGLSLSAIEGHVLPSLALSQQALDALAGHPPLGSSSEPPAWKSAQLQLKNNAKQLFGERVAGSAALPDIMVTFPSEAATDPRLVRDLLDAGMTVARINAAHDDAVAWSQMLENLHAAEAELGKHCQVHLDLAGPKVRTQHVQLPKGPKHQARKKYAKRQGRDHKRLYIGDTLLLAGHNHEAAYAEYDHLPCVSCTLGEAVTQVQQGQQVWFDDGKIGTVVEQLTPHGLLLRVTHARSKGEKLKEEKGINFPDTTLNLPALTEKDVQDLAFAVSHADTVGYSFVQTVDDIELLLGHMQRLGAPDTLGIILKIETRLAVSNIASLIARTAGARPCGVMIARGDLAVELGFGRLAEIQEELLWVCAAAHTPVVWATQVLESLVKNGTPSRGEFTDAAMGVRAEAVMLNKGPYIVQGVQELGNVLSRMHAHLHKDRPQYKSLGIAEV